MPGIVVFKRRWSVGSDDLVVPGVFLSVLHTMWLIVLVCIIGAMEFEGLVPCSQDLRNHVLGYIVLMTLCVITESAISWISMRGSILYTEPRSSMQWLLYGRLAILIAEFVWLVLGIVWMKEHWERCPSNIAKKTILGIVVCNWIVCISVLVTLWCTFDAAGRSWVKMQRYQKSLRQSKTKYKRSGNRRRNWRNRKTWMAYQQSWNKRCRLLFCCLNSNDSRRDSFTEIAKLLSEFFRDLDVVPSDVIAGLVLLRKQQKQRRSEMVAQNDNSIYQFLSGVPITPETNFLSFKDKETVESFSLIIHYMRYALAAYGWPMYMRVNPATGFCQLLPDLRCCCCCCRPKYKQTILIDDNFCQCHLAALRKLAGLPDLDLVYVTYHLDVGETPFFVALDHTYKKVVISIRGTLSLQDVLTDLNADAEQLPVDPPKENWLGHKGMVQAAEYIRRKLKDDMILSQTFGRDLNRGTEKYDLLVVGHSLGAGTAAILSILLKQEYADLMCYAFSPPGGLLSEAVVEATKGYITSVVVGKDVVPRIGLSQMESMRSDLISVIKRSAKPKWNIIMGSLMCCTNAQTEQQPSDFHNLKMQQQIERNFQTHPIDTSIALTTHTPMYPPGKIVHIVRSHPPKTSKNPCSKSEPVYQAIWADKKDFDEVLISPVMVQDHMPDKVLDALQKVLSQSAPDKPPHVMPEIERCHLLTTSDTPGSSNQDASSTGSFPKLYQETSFANEDETCSHKSSTVSLQQEHFNVCHSNSVQNSIPLLKPDKLCLTGDSLAINAPLASPEQFSDTSSNHSDSDGAKRHSKEFPKLVNFCSKMSPIAQSPSKARWSPGGYCFYEQYSPAEHIGDFNDHVLNKYIRENDQPLAFSTPRRDLVTSRPMQQVKPEKPPRLKEQSKTVSERYPLSNGNHLNTNGRNVTFIKNNNKQECEEPLLTDSETDISKTSKEPPENELPRQQELSLPLRSHSQDVLVNNHIGMNYSPTYPTYSNQSEYGNHNYHHVHGYHHCHSPYVSPLDHSKSDNFLAKLGQEVDELVEGHMFRTKETETITELPDECSPYAQHILRQCSSEDAS